MRTTHPVTTKLGSYVPLVMLMAWLDSGEIHLETVWHFLNIYFGCVFPKSDTLLDILLYLMNYWSDRCERKERCIGGILGELYDLDLWPHTWLRPWICQGQFQNSCISGIVIWSIRNEQEANQLDTGLTVWSCNFFGVLNKTSMNQNDFHNRIAGKYDAVHLDSTWIYWNQQLLVLFC